MRKVDQKETFEQAIQGERVIVMFSADWCPDCHVIEPALPRIEADYPEIDFIHADRDALIDVCQQYDIFGIPSFIGFKHGKEVDRFVDKNRKTEEEVTNFIDGYLEK
ncbi:thioredoxin [Geomicrobium sp. JCM 19037]|uniref:thioredoxin family protein n=1 Tax=unclassified Geomicrobium TaxID=2628951 RepID=UPI00045F3040|nr:MULTISPECIES: thioredoxin family protein [unclassified Geomicrobium]GAK02860.1 thioredoxin [Geomicrobium sp. JCM 19037]GAK12978.1 thioredoxin [Geomicrobium sp. JCM 19039]